MIIVVLLIILLFFFTFNKNETFIDNYIPDFISIYNTKLERYKNSIQTIKILLIGSISQKKLNFYMNYFNDAIFYVYNEDQIEYKNISEDIIQNESYPFMNEEVEKIKRNNIYFDIIITQGQINIDNYKFIAKNYINLLEKNGIIIFENIQSIKNTDEIIDSISLDIKLQFDIYDLRRVNGKYDNICIIVDKNNV